MRAPPRRGRYFPLSVEAVAAEIRRFDLRDDLGKPVDVSFVNPTPAQAREGVVATLTPKYELTLIPLPVEVDATDGLTSVGDHPRVVPVPEPEAPPR